MQILLILNKQPSQEMRVIVRVHQKSLRKKVVSLLEGNRDREAFELLLKKAEVETYLKPGEKAHIRPVLTLIEDLL